MRVAALLALLTVPSSFTAAQGGDGAYGGEYEDNIDTVSLRMFCL